MQTAILYYSRTGVTRTVAEALATKLDAELMEIRCPRYRPGALRYLRAGYDSVKGNLPQIEMPPLVTKGLGLLVIGGPVWTSHPALPLRSFLAQAGNLPPRIGLFLTYGGHSDSELAFAEMASGLPNPAEACIALTAADIGDGSYLAALEAFAAQLMHPASMPKTSARRADRVPPE